MSEQDFINEFSGLLILKQELFGKLYSNRDLLCGLLIEQPEYSARILPIIIPRTSDKYVAVFIKLSQLLTTSVQPKLNSAIPVKIVYNSVLHNHSIITVAQSLIVVTNILLHAENSVTILNKQSEHILSDIVQQLLVSSNVTVLESKVILIDEKLSLVVTANPVLAVHALLLDHNEELLEEMDTYTLKELDIVYYSD